MRVVIAHSRYLSAASGENQVVEDEARLLADAGHEVTRWEPSPEGDRAINLVKNGAGAVWSRSAVRHLRRLLRETNAEVLHCHNLFPMLSPAVLRTAESEGVAVVMTLHNYRLLCLPASLLREGRICEDCIGRVPWRGVAHRCYRGSTLGSASLAVSVTLHRTLRTFERPKLFLAVSDFVRRKYLEAGWPADRIRVKANFAWPGMRQSRVGRYFLYVGRLSEEKGLADLMRIWRGLSAPLVVVGDGPQAELLRELAPPSVEFVGQLARERVDEMLVGARALVMPSICFEGQPRAILEAYAAGVPVIASRIGGLSEVVSEGISGSLINPGDERTWQTAVEQLTDDQEAKRLGSGAFDLWASRFAPNVALEALERAYDDAMTGAPA